MGARSNSKDQEHGTQWEDPRVDRRTMWRYHLAKLLLSEKFDVALREALQAWHSEEILPRDLEFVVDIIRSAEIPNGATLEHESFPGESLAKALGIPTSDHVSRQGSERL